jgi:effector-binding domain-containing protein
VWNVIRSQNITGAGRHVAVYLDDVFNLEIGVELEAAFAGHGEVIGSATPAGAVAATTHFGPYNLLGQAHDAVQGWCRDHGHTVKSPCWEVYDHWQEAWNSDPSQIRTDVYYLLRSKEAL